MAASIDSAYGLAILRAARETGLDRALFPASCLWSCEQIMDDHFWPET